MELRSRHGSGNRRRLPLRFDSEADKNAWHDVVKVHCKTDASLRAEAIREKFATKR